MGAGGIVQNHAKVLIHAVSDPSVYECLTEDEKDRVELIRAKPFHERDQDDVDFMLDKLDEHCRRRRR